MNDFDRTNPQLWKWGLFYYNRNDSSLMVPKRNGLGWTFNFAHKMSYAWMIIILAIIILAFRYVH